MAKPAGPFYNTMDVLRSDLVTKHDFRTVGIAGHPEGSPAIAPDALRRAVADKEQWAADSGIQMHFVTQFGFDAQAVVNWETDLRRDGVELPIHVGMAGKTTPKLLLGYALRCGIGASMRALAGISLLPTSQVIVLLSNTTAPISDPTQDQQDR